MNNTRIEKLASILNSNTGRGIVPLITLAPYGYGNETAVKDAAKSIGHDVVTILCLALGACPTDLMPLPILGKDGEIEHIPFSLEILRNRSDENQSTVVILSEGIQTPELVKAVIAQLVNEGAVNTTVVIPTINEKAEEAQALLAEAMNEACKDPSPVLSETEIECFTYANEADIRELVVGYARAKDFAPVLIEYLESNTTKMNIRILATLDQMLKDDDLNSDTRLAVLCSLAGEDEANAFEAWYAQHGGE